MSGSDTVQVETAALDKYSSDTSVLKGQVDSSTSSNGQQMHRTLELGQSQFSDLAGAKALAEAYQTFVTDYLVGGTLGSTSPTGVPLVSHNLGSLSAASAADKKGYLDASQAELDAA